MQQQERVNAHYEQTVRGGIKGGIIGLGIGSGGVYFAQRVLRLNPAIFTLPLRAFIISSASIAGMVIAADKASLEFERQQWAKLDQYSYQVNARGKEPVVEKSNGERAIDFLREHRWTLVGGSWVVAIAGSLAYSLSKRNLTMTQKMVNARMTAQAATLGVLMVSAALSATDSKGSSGQHVDEQLRIALGLPRDGPIEGHTVPQEKRIPVALATQ
ncbi:uncharacterized protein VTP21DRAFT_1940 [Calcarisporiella thermophila]|uniref:uncharacterized protein n=1 Tax=Calcarisporiella thermophila TaxID=911321 RepID=UPI003742A5A7